MIILINNNIIIKVSYCCQLCVGSVSVTGNYCCDWCANSAELQSLESCRLQAAGCRSQSQLQDRAPALVTSQT